MEENLIKHLIDRWMSDKEAKTYITILEYGSLPASAIARNTSIKRVTTYGLLKDMSSKWIVYSLKKNGISYFQVIAPEKLASQLKNKYTSFEKILPELHNLADIYQNNPKIKYFEGYSGLKDLYDELLHDTKDIYAFLSDDEIDERLQEYLNTEFIQKRNKLWSKAHVIVHDTPSNHTYVQEVSDSPLHEVKIVTSQLGDLHGETILFGTDKVAFALYAPQEMTWFVVQNKQLYNTMKTLFDFVRKSN